MRLACRCCGDEACLPTLPDVGEDAFCDHCRSVVERTPPPKRAACSRDEHVGDVWRTTLDVLAEDAADAAWSEEEWWSEPPRRDTYGYHHG